MEEPNSRSDGHAGQLEPERLDTDDSPMTEQRLAALEEQVDSLATDTTGQEHRLIRLAQNAYAAMQSTSGWSRRRRLEAGGALVRYVFMGRATIVMTVGLGGLLALHASFMLADQNRKLDLQNYLSVVSSELGEAQRNSQFVQLIAPLIDDLRRNIEEQGQPTRLSATQRAVYEVDPALAVRIAVLTQTFQPYRWVQRDSDARLFLEPQGDGLLFGIMSWIRMAYDEVFGRAASAELLEDSKVPALTVDRLSPERGLLLVNLHALGFDLSSLTRWNSTFQGAFAPGARLDRIDLGNLIGPSLSTPFDLSFAALPGATFESAQLDNVDFTGASLAVVSFTSANAHNARFIGANLDQASFMSARLTGADFDQAYIGDADFSRANLYAAKLATARGIESTDFSNACLVRNSTEMPKSFDWSTYEIPMHCCSDWSGEHEPFEINTSGQCAAK